MKRLPLIALTAAALTSCASADLSQVSTLQLCGFVLNHYNSQIYNQPRQDAYLAELSKRQEDCSDFMHLRRPDSSDIRVNVNQ